MSSVFFGAFIGFMLAFPVRVIIATFSVNMIRRKGFCAQCGRKAPAVLGYTIDLETGEKYSAVFCAPCHSHQVQVIQTMPPPWS